MLKVGIVSLESTHVDAYCKLLNSDAGLDGMRVEGARVTALCRHEDPPQRVQELRQAYGIEQVCETPTEMLPHVDVAMILARDGDLHRGQALPFLNAGTPTFVDKPFAHSMGDAHTMVQRARDNGAPLMSCSSLRYAVELAGMQSEIRQLGPISHCHCSGPGELFFYGVHLVEMAHTLLGPGIQSVTNTADEHRDIMTLRWTDAGTASLSLLRNAEVGFHCSVFCDKGERHTGVADVAYYRHQLGHFVEMCRTGIEPIPLEHTLEIMRVLTAAQVSRNRDGATVPLAEV
ncbi:MAG: Gfo/Idh/MocA family oxidoreductase [Armatimonadota bacterium]|jgi:predicted dehydrogenase